MSLRAMARGKTLGPRSTRKPEYGLGKAHGCSANSVSNSPFISWANQLFTKGQFSALLGVVEVLTAALIAARPFSARLSALGSALAVGMFLTTLTFLVSTPGVIEPSLGLPALSVVPGQFLIKDVVLLGAALWTAGEALQAVQREQR